MSNYLRYFQQGGIYFFTVVTHRRRRLFYKTSARLCLRQAIEKVQAEQPFEILGFVLLPDHLHCLWKLPQNDINYSKRWGRIKIEFSRSWLTLGGKEISVSSSRKQRCERGIWQRRFWEHLIRDREDFANHMDYIHFNPVKHNLVSCPHLWEYSSFHRWINEGAYSKDWYCNCSRTKQDTPYFGNRYHDFGE